MKKIFIPLTCLLFIGAGCNNQSDLINQQQKQIEELTNKVNEIQATSSTLTVVTTTGTTSNTQNSAMDNDRILQKYPAPQEKKVQNVEQKTESTTNSDCDYPCNGKCYTKNVCTGTGATFHCGTNGATCCAVGATFCNGKCYNPCVAGSTFVCSTDGVSASCVANNENSTPNLNSGIVSKQELLNTFDQQLAEKIRQGEIESQKILDTANQMQAEIKPIQTQIDSIKAQEQEIGCNNGSMSSVIGSIAQQCATLDSQILTLTAQYNAVLNKYSTTPSSNSQNLYFNNQQTVSGQHYQFYYDGYGSGSIYNVSNPGESYKIYCSYGTCNIYGQ